MKKAINLYNKSHILYHTISHHWLLMPLGADAHTDILKWEQKQFQETRCMPKNPLVLTQKLYKEHLKEERQVQKV